MSTSTQQLDEVSASLNQQALGIREKWVKREARLPYVVNLRKNIGRGTAKPLYMLLSLAFADIDDGAPVGSWVSVLEGMIALLKARAAMKVRGSAVTFLMRVKAVMRRETNAQAKLDFTQMEAALQIGSLDVLLAMLAAIEEYEGALADLKALTHEAIANARLAQVA